MGIFKNRKLTKGGTALALVLVGSVGLAASISGVSVTSSVVSGTVFDPQTQTAAQLLAKQADAGRLAKQATFGATPALINHMVAVGTSAWLDEQFAATGSSYADIAAIKVPSSTCATSACANTLGGRTTTAMRFYSNALSQPDQLRQRVAFALSQLLVVSAAGQPWSAAGLASYQQLMLDNAFGNYRTLLQQVTMHAYMGTFLNMAGSTKAAPNENYARELLQLFSMGPNKLNNDGSLVTDSTGAAQPNYTPDDIKGVARALTGWTWKMLDAYPLIIDQSVQMKASPAAYDSTAKSFLGTTIPAGASQVDSVYGAVQAAFVNASTPPFVAKFLIQQLVTSNPTPAYVARVAAVFVNNGQNLRGDLKAVVRAILTDPEARVAPSQSVAGKVKEPILLMTSIGRAAGMVSDGQIFLGDGLLMGEAVFAAPSVFNFYPTDFPLAQHPGDFSPPSKLMTTPVIVNRNNMVYNWTIGAITPRSDFAPLTSYFPNATGTSIDWSSWDALNGDPAAIIDRIDLIMLNRTMTAAQKTALTAAANAIKNSNAQTQARLRAATLLYIVGSSPLFQVDR